MLLETFVWTQGIRMLRGYELFSLMRKERGMGSKKSMLRKARILCITLHGYDNLLKEKSSIQERLEFMYMLSSQVCSNGY